MTEFTNPFQSDKWLKLISSKNSLCNEHGEYEERTYLVQITKREMMITRCPACEAIKREKIYQQETKAMIEQNQRDYHQNIVDKLFTRAMIPPRFAGKTLDNFIETQENKINLAAVKKYVDCLDDNLRAGKGLIMFGGVGLGKSHLSCAIAEIAINKRHSAMFITASDLVDDVKDAFSSGKSEKIKIQDYTQPQLLIIDEVLSGCSEYETKTIAKILNSRYENIKSTIIITNLELKSDNQKDVTLSSLLGDRIIDRLRDVNKAILFSGKSWRGAK